MVVSVYAANVHRSLLLAMVLAIPALLERIVVTKSNAHSFSILNIVLTLVFDVVIVVVIFRHVLAAEQPTSETIFGALCLYLLVGFSFATVYGLVAAFQPFIWIRALTFIPSPIGSILFTTVFAL